MKSLPTDIAVLEARVDYEPHDYRTPMKFGGVAVSHCVVLNVTVRVRARAGREAEGSGSMPLSAVWGWPSKTISEPARVAAMQRLAGKIAPLLRESGLCAHPIELAHQLEPQTRALSGEMPRLSAMIVFSAFDAALHDAFGKVHGQHVYDCYGAEWMNADLARYLDDSFAGEYPDQYTLRRPKPRLPLYHLVGALDALTAADVKEPLDDGLPNTLAEWIERDGLTHLKIKLNGDDAAWDIERILAVEGVARETQAQRGVREWFYSLDFNEQCANVEYLLEVLRRVKEKNPAAFARIQYVEQPTSRDLRAHPENRMHAAAKLKPVVMDESLTDYQTLLLALEQGYTGVALKACKGQSQAIAMAAAAQRRGLFLCVQDLTCPGQSFLHTAGLAAHIPPVAAVEGNARQYIPRANLPWTEKFPAAFTVRAGIIETGGLDKVGLGH